MVKEFTLGTILLAQAITQPYDGVWQLGDKCDLSKTNDMLTISEGRTIGNGFVCYYDSVRQRQDGSYVVISRCYEGTNPAKHISYIMRADNFNIYIYNTENGQLHSKLSKCE